MINNRLFNKTVVGDSPMNISFFINFQVAAIPTPLRYEGFGV
jgi:hypothetical protein